MSDRITNPSEFVNGKVDSQFPSPGDQHCAESPSQSSMNENSLQPKNGYTKVPHFLIEHLMKRNFSEYESRVIWKVIRETYGWHRKEAEIIFDDFEKDTGLSRYHVWRTLSKLICRNVVGKRVKGHKGFYWIKEDFTKWLDISLRGDISSRGDTLSPSEETQISPPGETVIIKKGKKTKRKDICTAISSKAKKQSTQSPEAKAFIEAWCESFTTFFGKPYPIDKKKDFELAQEIMDLYPLSDMKSSIQRFFKEKDKFVEKAGRTIHIFRNQLARLLSTKYKPPVGSPEYYREGMKQYETVDEGASEESQTGEDGQSS